MCKHNTLIAISVIRRNNEFILDGWHIVWVDSCIAEKVQLMNMQGIVTTGCCCGHGELSGWILVDPEFIPALEKHGYQYIWPRDDIDDRSEWWTSREDIVIIKLPLLVKTWNDDDPEVGGWA